jgi:protein disulfide-isomerase A6
LLLNLRCAQFLTPSRFYAPWCGHCKNLKPAYEKAAKSLEGLAHVGAVNCDDEINKAFCGTMGVKGFPTLKTIKPTGSKGKPIVTDYQGERSAKAIVDAVKALIPNHVVKVTDKEIDKWLEERNSSAKAILFSDKGTTSALIKALAAEFRGNLQVAQIRDKETASVEKFGITSYPTLLVLPGGDAPAVPYDGPLEKKLMTAFLLQYATYNTDNMKVNEGKQKPINDEKASASDASTFSEASAAHASSEAAESVTSAFSTMTIDLNDEATPSPDPNVVTPDTDLPVALPVAPPLPTLSTKAELAAHCLGPKKPTCVLALLPPVPEDNTETPESVTEALASLADIVEKHNIRGSHLFPFYAILYTNEGAAALKTGLALGDGVQIVAINGRREWYKKFNTDKGYSLIEVEGWVDSIRLGEGKKEKLPAGLVVEEVIDDVTSAAAETASAATDAVKSKASDASEAATDATESIKDKAAAATDAAADSAASATEKVTSAASAASEAATDATESAKSKASDISKAAAESAASATDKVSSVASDASEAATDATDAAKETAASATDKVSSAASAASESVADATDVAKEKASSAASAASENAADATEAAKGKASSAASVVSESATDATDVAKEKATGIKEKIADAVESAAAKVSERASSVKHGEL